MNRDIEYYEQKVRDLQIENEVLREQLANNSRTAHYVAPETIVCTTAVI